jgi:hypothetical protein
VYPFILCFLFLQWLEARGNFYFSDLYAFHQIADAASETLRGAADESFRILDRYCREAFLYILEHNL